MSEAPNPPKITASKPMENTILMHIDLTALHFLEDGTIDYAEGISKPFPFLEHRIEPTRDDLIDFLKKFTIEVTYQGKVIKNISELES